MRRLTRRGFLTKGSIGLALVGGLAALPGLPAVMKLRGNAYAGARVARAAGPLVAHVRDVNTGEIALLVGSSRMIVHDPDLASRLHAASRPQDAGGM
jgi:hypothetical protein